jgi:hypothetical protein
MPRSLVGGYQCSFINVDNRENHNPQLVTCCKQSELVKVCVCVCVKDWYQQSMQQYLLRHLSFRELFHNQRTVRKPLTIACHRPCKKRNGTMFLFVELTNSLASLNVRIQHYNPKINPVTSLFNSL